LSGTSTEKGRLTVSADISVAAITQQIANNPNPDKIQTAQDSLMLVLPSFPRAICSRTGGSTGRLCNLGLFRVVPMYALYQKGLRPPMVLKLTNEGKTTA
jgi:hypothetical protein